MIICMMPVDNCMIICYYVYDEVIQVIKIKELREQRRQSLEAVARAIGAKRQAVWTWETGKSDPSTDNIVKLADHFGVTTDEILGRKSA